MSVIENCPDPAFPRGIGDLIEINEQSQAPFALIESPVLGAISLTIQDRLKMQRLPGLESTVNLFLRTLADSGERKPTVNRQVFKPIRDFQETQANLASRAIARYGVQKLAWDEEKKGLALAVRKAAKRGEPTEDFVRELEELRTRKPVGPKLPKLLLQDATLEVIARSLHENWPSTGLISDERAVIFDSRAIGRPCMLNPLWGGDPYPVERVIQPSFTLRDVRLTFAVMEQPGMLQTFLAGKGATK